METTDTAVMAAALQQFVLIAGVVGIVFYAITSFLLSKVFSKAGVEPWKAWVPIYNNWIFFELGGQKAGLSILLLFPIVNIVGAVYGIIAAHKIGLAFGKSTAWTVLYFFCAPVWYALLGFGSAQYNSGRDTTQDNNVPSSNNYNNNIADNSNYDSNDYNSQQQAPVQNQWQQAPLSTQQNNPTLPPTQLAPPRTFNAPPVVPHAAPTPPQLGTPNQPTTPLPPTGLGGFKPPTLPNRFPPLPPTPRRNPSGE